MHPSAPFRWSFTASEYGLTQSSRRTDCNLVVSASGPASEGGSTGLRASATTLVMAELRRAWRITSDPTNPVAPVTINFILAFNSFI